MFTLLADRLTPPGVRKNNGVYTQSRMPPDVTGDRPAKQDKLLKKVAKTYGPFTEWEWIEFSKTPLQKRLFFSYQNRKIADYF